MKLSIIIPAFNAEPYITELLDVLMPQITKEVEVIVIDDGSKEPFKTKHKGVKSFRKLNGGAASARNMGLEKAKGEYIAFIDADDMVSTDYVEQILKKTEEGFDVCEFSWKTWGREGVQFNYKLNSPSDRLRNPSACTRCFSRKFIGDVKFSEIKDAVEDEDFSRRLGYLDPENHFQRVNITNYIYFYRTAVENSQSKRFKKGLHRTKRVVYYYDHVTRDMTDLVEEIKEDDKLHEVWLLTNQNDIPELKRWCQISRPIHIWTHYLKGEPYSNCEIIPPVIKTQVVLFVNQIHEIGGIETFIYNFVRYMKEYYDIAVMIRTMTDEQHYRFAKQVQVIRDINQTISCDTLIVIRILDDIPTNVFARRTIRMCHACKTTPYWHIKPDCDYVVNVSEASKKSFGEEAKDALVIHNMFYTEHKKALLLVSATRIPAPDKGSNEKRMLKLAEMLNEANIPFIWMNFSEGALKNAPKGFYNMGAYQDIQPYLARADYLVQLSDSEAYSYSVLEALTNNVPVICTPFSSAEESGVIDGVTGHIIPFDMKFDVTKLLDIPKFEDHHENESIIAQWRELLGSKKPLHNYKPNENVIITATQDYYDTELMREVQRGETYTVTRIRAEKIKAAGFAIIREG